MVGEVKGFLEAIQVERKKVWERRIRFQLQDQKDFGLAISGGGIRSATFALGVLQTLARHKLIRRIDYLSTVSGGGYIGSWLIAWMSRTKYSIDKFEQELAYPRPIGHKEPKEIRWLRSYSNYLAPSLSFFNADGWNIATVWARNCALNLCVLVSLLSAVLLFPKVVGLVGSSLTSPGYLGISAAVLYLICFLYSIWRSYKVPCKPVDRQSRPLWPKAPKSFHPWLAFDCVFTAAGFLVAAGLGSRALELRFPWLLTKIAQTIPWLSPVVYGAPLALLLNALVITIFIALVFRNDYQREWWGRLGAWISIFAASWLVLAGISFNGPNLVGWLLETRLVWGPASIAWLISTYGVLVGGWSKNIVGKQSSFKETAIQISPFVAVLGIMLAISSGLESVVSNHIVSGFLFVLGLTVASSYLVDINEFSMHHLYRNRLVRCYLGASNSKRCNDDGWDDQSTGFAPSDDIKLIDFEGKPLPCHIINTAINLSDLDSSMQARHAAAFAFGAEYSGFSIPGSVDAYRSTSEKVTLGQAFTISGAAASPNMGYHTSGGLAFLMTMFNVRLGWWFPNPRKDCWESNGPDFGLRYLLTELMGSVGKDTNYVYLSDGGHFENLGVYELLRRECRYILCLDGSEDHKLQFECLGDLVRKARADLNVEIDISESAITSLDDKAHSRSHCTSGRITYPSGKSGILVYLKTSITGDEDADILQYQTKNSEFPHETTGDQFFSESQFESYRRLGWHVATSALRPALYGNGELVEFGTGIQVDLERLFVRLHQAWGGAKGTKGDTKSQYGEMLAGLMDRLRSDPELRPMDKELFPEWVPVFGGNGWGEEDQEGIAQRFYLCHNVIQLMESIYLDLDLETNYGEADSAAWINLFMHFAGSDMFRTTYAITAGTFNGNFRSFCERHLKLDVARLLVEGNVDPAMAGFNKWEEQRIHDICRTLEGKVLVDRIYVEVSPLFGDRFSRFTIGFSIRTGAQGMTLNWIRIQNHLRAQGFGRKALLNLLGSFHLNDVDTKRLEAVENLWEEQSLERVQWVRDILSHGSSEPG